MKIREFMKLGILSLNWVSEHYELEFVKSLISRTKFKIINIQLSISPVLQSAQPPIRFLIPTPQPLVSFPGLLVVAPMQIFSSFSHSQLLTFLILHQLMLLH